MAYVNTVLGPIHPGEMGITAMHEHIIWGLPKWECDPGFWFDTARGLEKCYDALMDFKLMGGQTYLDCSGIGMGRDIDFLAKLASSIRQLNIVASTGFGADHGIAPHFRNKNVDYFEHLFFQELTKGLGHTNIRVGVISIGSAAPEVTKLEEKVYRAAARSARRTGAAVMMIGFHSTLNQLNILTGEKLDPSRIVVSHLNGDGHIDLEFDKEVARRGAYVAYDDIGVQDWSKMPYRTSDGHRVELILTMIKAGFQDRILLSTGSRCQQLSWGESSLNDVAHLFRYFLPKLKQARVSEETIHKMLVENPKRVLPIQ
jgi:predicted metal-dependent phosphotriesterase family hydrolase